VLHRRDCVMTLQVFYFSVPSFRDFVIRGRSVAEKAANRCMEKTEMLNSPTRRRRKILI
jgi:hypothetical protein